MVFSTQSVQRGYKEDNWGDQVSSVRETVKKRGRRKEFCKRVWDERTSAHEAEESPLSKTVTRERTVKTQQARKGLAAAVVICELW
jgi:RNase H-fold protein (predicted Holliday junction resolvase)